MKKIAIIVLTLSLLLLAFFGQQPQNVSKGAFLGGTQGIVADFEAFGVEENGLYTIFDEEAFPLEVTLANKGEYSVQPNEITVQLLGPSPDEFNSIGSWLL